MRRRATQPVRAWRARTTATVGVLAVAASLATGAGRDAAGAATTVLTVGQPFPAVAGQSPAGVEVRLPPANGLPYVIAYSNTKQGGRAVAMWSHALYQKLPRRIGVFAIADVSATPGLIRGFAVADVRKSANPISLAQHRSHIMVITAKSPLQGAIPPGPGENAVLIAVDAKNRVVAIERTPYAPATAGREATRFAEAIAAAKP